MSREEEWKYTVEERLLVEAPTSVSLGLSVSEQQDPDIIMRENDTRCLPNINARMTQYTWWPLASNRHLKDNV